MRPRRVVTTQRADEDIAAVIEHYVGQGATAAGLAFVDALEEASVLISEHPHVGSTRLGSDVGIPEMRTVTLRTFPCMVFFTDDSDAVRIHRLLHTARDIPSGFMDG